MPVKEKKRTHKEILLDNAETIIEMIRAAKTYDDIQERFGGVSRLSLPLTIPPARGNHRRNPQKKSLKKLRRQFLK